ncbi:hypothetical protein E1A91_D02G117700v1 [Gossypium mustelinum]|uniref:Uncharacterized protein n=3 Tax=Gossypium TaxID=3633 RepID=A0A5J5SBP3_GOSBA|nr:hypothetical protein ES319_D02G112100v1 [Gossypium barbadense]TYG79173.1 hypothetical protein ES288_D02G119800v1 [Gossypium darwinii]TYI93138.1 hypothetical protein E1A91_D02G117700v1 [Gossypium mustelinum]
MRIQCLKELGKSIMRRPKKNISRFNPLLLLNMLILKIFLLFPLQVRLHREWNKIFRPWNLMELKRILIQLSKVLWGVGVQLTDGILDPDKHSAVIFKENLHSKSREHAVGRKFEALEAGSLRNIERKNSSKVGFGWGG